MTQTAAILDNTKVLVDYLSDDGNHYAISMPKKYLAASQMTQITAGSSGTFRSKPARFFPRHYWLNGLNAAGKLVRRKLIYNAGTNIAQGTVFTIDGITFETSGYVGERHALPVVAQ